MTASDLHNLIVASGLPVEKWPIRWFVADGGWYISENFPHHTMAVTGQTFSLRISPTRAAMLFTAVLVEELLSSTMHPDMPTGAAIGWTIRKFRNGRYDVGLKYEATTLLEALCAAYREVKK